MPSNPSKRTILGSTMPSSRDSREVAKAGRLAIHPVAKSLRRYDLTGRGRPREAAPGVFSRRARDKLAYCALNCLWRLSAYPDERTPHPLTISKPVLPGNFLRGEAPGLHHQSCGLHAQPLDCLPGGPPRFLSEQSAELPPAQKRGVRQGT